MARRQHRTISTVVEWGIELALIADGLGAMPKIPEVLNLEDGRQIEHFELQLSLLDKLWAPHPWERLQRFLKYAPNLMSFDETVIWSKIQELPQLWDNGKLNNQLLKAAWSLFETYAEDYEMNDFDQAEFDRIVGSLRKPNKSVVIAQEPVVVDCNDTDAVSKVTKHYENAVNQILGDDDEPDNYE